MCYYAGIVLILLTPFMSTNLSAQDQSNFDTNGSLSSYVSVDSDPMNVRHYKLANGLSVYVSRNESEPRAQMIIAVKAGSKHDPPHATGLAHYLEHMLFKGTDRLGTMDFSAEAPVLARIEELFEQYRSSSGTEERTLIYSEIDSLSGEAAKHAIPNEFDKVTTALGVRGSNAFTSTDMTCYINDVPSSELRKMLRLESERMRMTALRLFHTELETVYEEKNRSLDDDASLSYEALMASLFPTHTYGTQTTLGTTEHLKNPSMREIKKFFATWYVPSNMAVIVAGDVDPDSVVSWVDETFGQLPERELHNFPVAEQEDLAHPIRIEMSGPSEENILMGFRLPAPSHPDMPALIMLDMVLSNRVAGLLDINLNQQQLCIDAGSYLMSMNDYSVHMFFGRTMPGDSLENVESRILSQIELVKQGKFDSRLLQSALIDREKNEALKLRTNQGRAFTILNSFVFGISWANYVNLPEVLRSVTVSDVERVASRYYNNSFVSVLKRHGELAFREKVEKPHITPIVLNRDTTSEYLSNLLSEPSEAPVPSFLDFKTDFDIRSISDSVTLTSLRNDEDGLFDLRFVFPVGTWNEPLLELAADLTQYISGAGLGADELRLKMYSLGMEISVRSRRDETTVRLSGVSRTFDEALKLLGKIWKSSSVAVGVMESFRASVIRRRDDLRKDRQTILFQAMLPYALYDGANDFNRSVSKARVASLNAEDMISLIEGLLNLPCKIYYHGPEAPERIAGSLKECIAFNFCEHDPTEVILPVAKPADLPVVLYVHYDMIQAELLSVGVIPDKYSYEYSPTLRLLNEYFSGGMSGLLFQNIREAQALAYSTFGSINAPAHRSDNYTTQLYVGTQFDKVKEALNSVSDMIQSLPRIDGSFENARRSVLMRAASERRKRMDALMFLHEMQKFGIDFDINEFIYNTISSVTWEDVDTAFKRYISRPLRTMLVLGDRERVDFEVLSTYGQVREVTLDELFGD